MAFTTSLGYTDTIKTEKNLSIPDLDYANDFAVTEDSSSNLVLTNITSPIDQPETLRIGYQHVGNIYNGTNINPSYMAVTKAGVSVVSQVHDILRVTCEPETGCNPVIFDLPIKSHVVISVPLSQYVTADLALAVAKRGVSGLFDTGSVASTRLNQILRDALKPSTM